MHKFLSAAMILVAWVFPSQVLAAPGEYWEVTTKMDMPGMPFAMPATTQKVCVAKGGEKDPRKSSKNKDCQMSDVKISGNKTSWKFSCKENGGTMTGSGEQTTSAGSFKGKMHISSEDGDMTQTYSGKRVGGSCDSGAQAREVKKQADQMMAQTCDTDGRSISDLVGMADIFLAKNSICADKRDTVCRAIRSGVNKDAEGYVTLVEHDKQRMPGYANVSKACGVNMNVATRSICKTINDESIDRLSPYCPKEAKAWREAARKRECDSLKFASKDEKAACLAGRSYTTGHAANSQNASSGKSVIPDNPAGAAIEGAKKLKGLFGF